MCLIQLRLLYPLNERILQLKQHKTCEALPKKILSLQIQFQNLQPLHFVSEYFIAEPRHHKRLFLYPFRKKHNMECP